MPLGNNFEHAAYARADPGERVAYREYQAGAAPDSPAWHEALAQQGDTISRAGVRAVVFLHGTMLGTDPFGVQRLDEAGGLKRGYSRGIPGVDGLLALMRDGTNGLSSLPDGRKPPLVDDESTRRSIDEQAGDAANFTTASVERVAKAINGRTSRPIVCRRMLWSSEHHHLGRAKAAIELLSRLHALTEELRLGHGDRLLVLAHGQAGLLLALLSNLLAPTAGASRQRVLSILGQAPPPSPTFTAMLQHLSGEAPALLRGAALDVVTLGTPVRYGWDPSGLGRLLHLVNHRMMRSDGKRWLAKMDLPQITMEMPIAWGGDYVQQLGVAGSDAVPPTEPEKALNKALWEILEPYDGFERWLECTRKCVRCQNDGRILLVDYKDGGSATATNHYYGHAAYTRLDHLLFNMVEICQSLYSGTRP